MNLETIRKELEEKSAAAARISEELEVLHDELGSVSRAARQAAEIAKERSVQAVILGTLDADAEAAKARELLAAAVERETALRDRQPLLQRAAGRLQQEIEALNVKRKVAEDEVVASVLRGREAQAKAKINEAVAELVAFSRARGYDFPELSVLIMAGVDPQRAAIFQQAAKVREQVLAGKVTP